MNIGGGILEMGERRPGGMSPAGLLLHSHTAAAGERLVSESRSSSRFSSRSGSRPKIKSEGFLPIDQQELTVNSRS